jgi:hypothetical protein
LCNGKLSYCIYLVPDTVIFDNTYSYIRSKTLHYSIAMISPMTAKDDDDDDDDDDDTITLQEG